MRESSSPLRPGRKTRSDCALGDSFLDLDKVRAEVRGSFWQAGMGGRSRQGITHFSVGVSSVPSASTTLESSPTGAPFLVGVAVSVTWSPGFSEFLVQPA